MERLSLIGLPPILRAGTPESGFGTLLWQQRIHRRGSAAETGHRTARAISDVLSGTAGKGGPLPSPRPNSTGRGAAPGLQEQPRPLCSRLSDLEKMVGRWKWCPGRTATHPRTRGSPDALGSTRFLPVAHTCQGRGKASRKKKELTDPGRQGVKNEGSSAKGAGLRVDRA